MNNLFTYTVDPPTNVKATVLTPRSVEVTYPKMCIVCTIINIKKPKDMSEVGF